MHQRGIIKASSVFSAILLVASVALTQPVPAPTQPASALEQLSSEFWEWRASEQPFSFDDIPRIDRPEGWAADWSSSTIAKRRNQLAGFERRYKELGRVVEDRPRADTVDYLLVGSAIARARWELDYVRGWQRNPWFYLDQTLASVFVSLTQPPPFDEARSAEIVRRVQAIPQIIADGEANLKDPTGPLAQLSIHQLNDIRPRVEEMARELKPQLTMGSAAQLDAAVQAAIQALEGYRAWLEQRLPAMSSNVAVGRDNYVFFLKHVALIPYTPEQLRAMGRQEWERAVAFEAYEKNRNAGLRQLPLAKDQGAQIAREERQEQEIRNFLAEKNILTVPAWVQHYRNLPFPAYLAPLAAFGVADDLTGPTRLKDQAISYIKTPSPDRGYFDLSTARDPRGIIVHEGMPGHYFQNPVLKRYFIGVLVVVAYAASAAYVGLGLVLGLPHAVLLALLTGVLEMISVVGPGASAVIAGLVAIHYAAGIGAIVAYAIYATALRISIDQLFGPLALGAAARLHPVLVIFCFLSGAFLFGVVGVIMAVPVALVVKVTLALLYDELTTEVLASK